MPVRIDCFRYNYFFLDIISICPPYRGADKNPLERFWNRFAFKFMEYA